MNSVNGGSFVARTKSITSYPNAAFYALVQRVLAERSFLVPCTKAQAASMRGELYAWRRACETAPAEAERIGVNPADLRLVAFKVGDAGMTGILAEDLVTPSLIGAALGVIPDMQSAASLALTRLRAAGLAPSTGQGDGQE